MSTSRARPRRRKAQDFSTLMSSAQAEEDLMDDWWDFQCKLREAIFGILRDDDEDDPTAAAATSLAQFTQAVLAWVARADQAGIFDDDDDDDKAAPADEREFKEGRKMSAVNHKAFKAALDQVAAGHTMAQAGHKKASALLVKLKPANADKEPASATSDDDKKPGQYPNYDANPDTAGAGSKSNHPTGAGATNTTPVDVKDLLALLRQELAGDPH